MLPMAVGERGFSLSPYSLQIHFLFLHLETLKSAPVLQVWGACTQALVPSSPADLLGETHRLAFCARSCCPRAKPGGSWAAARWESDFSSCLLRNPTTKINLRGLYLDKRLRTEKSSLASCPKKKLPSERGELQVRSPRLTFASSSLPRQVCLWFDQS